MIKKLAITAFALSMTAAFAGNDKVKTASTDSAQPNVAMETPKTSMSSSSSSSADSSQVKQVQQALKDKGQYQGSIDGKMGPKTTAALQSFQQSQGISGSGLDQQTLSALGISGGASASASNSSSSQPSTSSSMSSDQPAASSSSATSSGQPATSSSQSTTSSNQPSSTTSSTTNATKQ